MKSVECLAAGSCGYSKFVYTPRDWKSLEEKFTEDYEMQRSLSLPGKFPTHKLLNAGKCFKEILLYICTKPMFFLGRPLLEAGC